MFTTSTLTTALGVSKDTGQDTCSLTHRQKAGLDMTINVGDTVRVVADVWIDYLKNAPGVTTVTRDTTETFTRNNA